MRKKTRNSLIVAGVLTVVAAGVLSGTVVASAGAPGEPDSYITSVKPVERFETNDSGQTLGFVDVGLVSDPSARAELVAVTTDEGKEGWAYSIELMPWLSAKTPAEAQGSSTDAPYAVAVYESDGRTLIGYQTVNRPMK